MEIVQLLSENPRGSEASQDIPYGCTPLDSEMQEAFIEIFPLLYSEGILQFDWDYYSQFGAQSIVT